MLNKPQLNNPLKPLVSVLIFNYNYGSYLEECIESVLNQTYENIEISFSDNASTDESWAIVLRYLEKYPDIMNVTSNRINFGADANYANCFNTSRGKYLIQLCSDDALMPDYVEKCVNGLEANPNAGFALVHRLIIDENGNEVEEPPFYNRTCVIPGPEQAAVYMMAAVNPSISQIMYDKDKAVKYAGTGGLAARWYGSRMNDFNMSCEFPVVYIKDALLKHRLHFQNDSFRAADSLMEVIGPYILHHQFVEVAEQFKINKVIERLPKSIEKLSRLSLRYCIRALTNNNERDGLRYYHLSLALDPDILDEKVFVELKKYWKEDKLMKQEILNRLNETDNIATRTVSYDPPEGSIPFNPMINYLTVS